MKLIHRRRLLMTSLAGIVAALAAAAAQEAAKKVYRIGYFVTFQKELQNQTWNALAQGLRDHGYVEGE